MTVCNYKQFILVDLFPAGITQEKEVCEQAIYQCRDCDARDENDRPMRGVAQDWRVPANWSAKIIGEDSLNFVVRVTRISN